MSHASGTPVVGDFEQQLREMNEALLVSSIRQHELTEQAQQAEAALRDSEGRYHKLFNSMDEGYCIIEMIFDEHEKPVDYRFLEVNSAFDKHSGMRDVTGKRMLELVSDVESHWLENFGNVSLTGAPIRFANESKSLGRWFDVYAFKLGGQDSRRVAILFTDITERIRLERKTREQADALADLHRRKDEFLAMLSHELRNPLAPILTAVQLLRLQQDKNPLQQEAHATIERQVAQLTRLVDDLLEVSRISTGRIHLQQERVDLRGIVTRAIETTQSQVGQKGQSVTKLLPAEPLWVYGDPMRLEQVLVNLLNNASKYTDRGGHIWVGLNQEGDEAVLRVRDNGMGITPDLLPHIFDLFTQADRSLDRSQGGLGIGLALVQSLVTLHRGSVKANSTLGQGSEFIVKLPVHTSPSVPVAAAPEIAARSDRGLRVLVVDDNFDAARIMAMLLRAFGHNVQTAHDGALAMQAALEFVPQVMLLDIGLPVVNGFQVAQWVRQQSALNDMVLVALTGYGQESDLQQSREAGFDHHLVKPVDFAKVQSILAEVAEKKEVESFK